MKFVVIITSGNWFVLKTNSKLRIKDLTKYLIFISLKKIKKKYLMNHKKYKQLKKLTI